MAVQLPNFLSAGIQKPDYSALSDIFENYYSGKNMPRQDTINEYQAKGAPLDFLMKQIQAKFAEPNAEAALTGAKLGNQGKSLSNRQTQMTLQKLQQELRNQAEVEASVRQSLAKGGAGMGVGNGGGMGGGMPMPMNQPPQMGQAPNMGGQAPNLTQEAPNMMTSAPQAPGGAEGVRQQQNGNALEKGLMEVMQHQAMKNQPMPTQAPLMNEHPAESRSDSQSGSKVEELDAGTPALYGLDELWDKKPHLRPYIEKNYGKKEVKPEYDKKTGQNRIRTTWPSGRITVKTVAPQFNEEDLEKGIPLTTQVLNKVVNQVRGADAVLPYIDKIIDMGENGELPHSSLYWSDASANFESTVDEALEGYMSSTGASNTDLSTKKMESILGRHFNESTANYIKRLKKKKEELAKARVQNVKMITKGLKKNPNMINESSGGKSYSSDEWEPTHE